MSNLEELKDICQAKKDTALELKKDIDNAILRRDVRLLLEKNNVFDNPKPDVYLVDSLEIKINNGILEINDKRGSSFLWCFEIMYNRFNYRLGDAFIYNNENLSVALIDNASDDILLAIEKVISEYNETIEYLKGNNDFAKYTYYYECNHEEKTCLDIFELYDTVLQRKY